MLHHSGQYMLSYDPLITSAVAGQQLYGSVSTGNARWLWPSWLAQKPPEL